MKNIKTTKIISQYFTLKHNTGGGYQEVPIYEEITAYVLSKTNNIIGTINDGSSIEFVNSGTSVKVIEAWTYNGGQTVFVNYIGEYLL